MSKPINRKFHPVPAECGVSFDGIMFFNEDKGSVDLATVRRVDGERVLEFADHRRDDFAHVFVRGFLRRNPHIVLQDITGWVPGYVIGGRDYGEVLEYILDRAGRAKAKATGRKYRG